MIRFGRTVVLVSDYDEALRFYRDVIGFSVICDLPAPEGDRFVHVGIPEQENAGLWLLRSRSEKDRALVGRQAAQHPLLVLYCPNIEAEITRLEAEGVAFHVPATTGEGATFAHFKDLYGNELILVQLLADSE